MDSTRTNLLLVRHAETECNVASRLSGWTDSRLSPLGEAQVELLAAHFNRAHCNAAAVYASPLVRTRRTAEAIARLTGHALVFDPDLREMHFGDLDGRPLEDVRTGFADLLRLDESPEQDFAWPGGESRNAFTARVRGVLDRIASAHPGEDVAVVTHGGVISTFLTIVHGQPPGLWREWLVNNASLTEVSWDPVAGVGALLRRGDDAHLAALLSEEAASPG
jgi:probable phosphoglycerate mutase